MAGPPAVTAISDLLRLRAEAYPDRVALEADGADTLAFGDWHARSDRAAGALARRGVGPGSRIGLLFEPGDWSGYAVAYLGVLKAGAAAAHLSTALDPAELRRRAGECRVDAIVHSADGPAGTGLAGWSAVGADLVERGGEPPRTAVGPDAIADILYTSGTTGPAKAFTNPHGTLTFGRGPEGLKTLDSTAPMLAPTPMGTASSAMVGGMMPITSPSPVLVCDPHDAQRVIELVAERRPTTLLLTPWLAIRLIRAAARRRFDLSSVTTIGFASAPLPAAVGRRVLELFPAAVINTAYAQGEAVPAVVLGSYDPDRPTALGRPAPGTELRLAGPDGAETPPGELGEIWIRSAAPKRLYLDAELNRTVHADGWTRTRDLGRLDEDGVLHLFDRQADVITVAGEPVSTIEIEGALYDHPAVEEAAVYGVPSGDGEAVAAAVVTRAGLPVDEPGLRAFLAERLEPRRMPASITFRTTLPRGLTGKVLKRRLRGMTPQDEGVTVIDSESAAALPVAQQQTSLSPKEIQHSANSGVVVERVGQLRSEFRSEGRRFARELSEYINTKYVGIATVFVYEETFGTEDRLHWLIHLQSLDAYETLVQMGSRDEGWREIIMRNQIPAERGGGGWERMFLDGSLTETVMIPQSYGMYGTADQTPESVRSVEGEASKRFVVPVAAEQVALPAEDLWHSGNCGILIHRVGQLDYRFRAEGRAFSRAVAEVFNKNMSDHVTIYLFEEAFGVGDRVHWLIHLKSLTSYYHLMGLRAQVGPEAREIYTKPWVAEEKGGGGWERLFIQSSLEDLALTPQHPGMYATARD